MSRIRNKDTKPEIIVRQFLFGKGFRYKLHDKTLPGRPDLVFPKYKTVMHIHGCFWHRHPHCRLACNPKSKVKFWQKKFGKNIERDRFVKKELRKMGWKVIVVWECELKNDKKEKTITKILKGICQK